MVDNLRKLYILKRPTALALGCALFAVVAFADYSTCPGTTLMCRSKSSGRNDLLQQAF